jgi:hypothetical protein
VNPRILFEAFRFVDGFLFPVELPSFSDEIDYLGEYVPMV